MLSFFTINQAEEAAMRQMWSPKEFWEFPLYSFNKHFLNA